MEAQKTQIQRYISVSELEQCRVQSAVFLGTITNQVGNIWNLGYFLRNRMKDNLETGFSTEWKAWIIQVPRIIAYFFNKKYVPI